MIVYCCFDAGAKVTVTFFLLWSAMIPWSSPFFVQKSSPRRLLRCFAITGSKIGAMEDKWPNINELTDY